MFGRSFFRVFEDDPFFAGFMEKDRKHRLDRWFDDDDDGDPFYRPQLPGRIPIYDEDDEDDEDDEEGPKSSKDLLKAPYKMMERDMVGNMWLKFDKMFERMRDNAGVNEGVDYRYVSTYKYSNDCRGKPKVYHAATSTMQCPGGVKEVRKALKDTTKSIEKLSVGRHDNDQGHIKTRSRDTDTGDYSEDEEFINMNEKDSRQFDKDWEFKVATMLQCPGKQRIQGFGNTHDPRYMLQSHRNTNESRTLTEKQRKHRDTDKHKRDRHRRQDDY